MKLTGDDLVEIGKVVDKIVKHSRSYRCLFIPEDKESSDGAKAQGMLFHIPPVGTEIVLDGKTTKMSILVKRVVAFADVYDEFQLARAQDKIETTGAKVPLADPSDMLMIFYEELESVYK